MTLIIGIAHVVLVLAILIGIPRLHDHQHHDR